MLSTSEENYIKEIYTLEQKWQTEVNTNLLANKIETKASSVTDMLKKLAKKDLLNYQKYKGVKLNAKGKETAINVIRKHRLWETFLVEKLNFSWDEVHDIAEQLEHIKSDKLIDQLEVFLNFPTADPHGDPIPNKNGEFIKVKTRCLNTLQEGEKGVFVEVKNDSATFLKFLTRQNIVLYSTITVIHKEAFDNSITIEINNTRINISKHVVEHIYLKV